MTKKIFLYLTVMLLVPVFLTGCVNKTITEEELKQGLDKYINSEYNSSNYEEVSVSDSMIKVTLDKQQYILNYDLDNNPTFTYEVEIKKGISYNDYFEKIENLSLPMLGYISSAYTYGIDIKDSSTYFALSYVDGMMNNYNEDAKYIVVEDAEGLESDAEIILTSEFGDKVIDFVKDSYKKDIKLIDKEYNTYTYKLQTKCEENSCKLIAKLTVNSKGDFKSIKGYSDELSKKSMYEKITPETTDYHIELKVGQSIEIEGENLNGYELSGMDVVEVEGEYTFTAVSEGIANGYLYIGDDKTKSIYITVTKAEKDENLETKNLSIN